MRKYQKPTLYTEKPYRVLVPILDMDQETERLIELAHMLAQERGGELILLHVVVVPEDEPFSHATLETRSSRQELDQFLQRSNLHTAHLRTEVRVAREVWEGIWEAIVQDQVDAMLLAWDHQDIPGFQQLMEKHLHHPPCDVIILRSGPNLYTEAGWKAAKRILLAVRSTPEAVLALRVATVLASTVKGHITYLHVVEPEDERSESELLAAFAPVLRNFPFVTRSITTHGDIAESILEEAHRHDVLVMGAPSRLYQSGTWTGTILERLLKTYNKTLLIVKQRALETSEALHFPQDRYTTWKDRPVSVVVNKWFAENTFHSHEFADLERLLLLKEQQGVTISLGLPALNEEETVGNVISTIKKALMEEVPLLDEMVLIDSGSVDYTREIAADLGIPVYIHQELLTRYGAYHGKGEALWKSLYILNGDIIAWIDTDIKNIHPRFVYGIIGPLLRESRIQYVKGFYRRPLKEGEKLVAGGGGRVTELTARPLLNLFFPELSGLIQPLSGEYAGRREALEQVPFFTGYGVETGLLIDMLSRFGLPAIAQSDLLERIHHNQPLPSLSKMAFAIIQVVIRRLEDRHKIRLLEDINKTMNLIRYDRGRYYLEPVEVIERERPPMLSIPEYRKKRGLETPAEEAEEKRL